MIEADGAVHVFGVAVVVVVGEPWQVALEMGNSAAIVMKHYFNIVEARTAATPWATPSQVESSVPPVPEPPAATPTPTPYVDILKEGIANMHKIKVPSDKLGIVICATSFHAFAKVAEEAEQQHDPGLTK